MQARRSQRCGHSRMQLYKWTNKSTWIQINHFYSWCNGSGKRKSCNSSSQQGFQFAVLVAADFLNFIRHIKSIYFQLVQLVSSATIWHNFNQDPFVCHKIILITIWKGILQKGLKCIWVNPVFIWIVLKVCHKAITQTDNTFHQAYQLCKW